VGGHWGSPLIGFRLQPSDFRVGDAGQVSLRIEEVALVLAVEIGGIDRAGEVGDEHSIAGNVEGDADALHQVGDQELRRRLFLDRCAIDGVAAGRIAAVGPIENAVRHIELEVDRLRQLIEQHLDVGTVRRILALRDVDIGAEDTALAAVVRAFLRPVDFAKLWIDGDSNAPPGLIATVLVAAAGPDQRFNLRAVEVRAHHAHALAVAPIELAAVLIEVDLLRRVRDALRDNDLAVAAVEVGALDRAVVEVGDAHIGPVDMTGLHIDDDAVGQTAI